MPDEVRAGVGFDEHAAERAEVVLVIEPAKEFGIAFKPRWPAHLLQPESAPLVQALLRGVAASMAFDDAAARLSRQPPLDPTAA